MKTITSLLLAGAFALALALAPAASAQPVTLEKLWEKAPDDYPQFLATSHLERGMAYNAATGHLLIPSRNDGAIHIIEAADGAYVGKLDAGSGVISGGLFLINKIGVDDDGAVFVGNMVTDSSGDSTFNLYRWADEGSLPVRVFSGDPGGGNSGEIRWGDSLAVRGSGTGTEIILGSYGGSVLAVLRPGSENPAETDSYAAQQISTPVAANHMRNVTFGPGNLVYITATDQDLYELEINFETGEVENQRIFDGGKVTRYLGPLGYGAEEDILAGVVTTSHQLWIYRRAQLTTQWLVLPAATISFAPPLADDTYVSNGNATGEAIVVGDIVYALDTNNGIMAAQIVPIDPIQPGDLLWSTATEIKAAKSDGSDVRALISGLSRPIGLFIDSENEHIYWAEDAAGRIARSNFYGTNVTEIISDRGDETNPAPVTTPQGVLVVNDRIYWSEFSTGLYSANLDGSDPQHLINAVSEGTSAVTFDDATGRIHLAATSSGTLYSINPDGSGQDEVAIPTNTYGIAFDSGGTLFRTNFSSGLIEAVTEGAPAVTLFDSRDMPLGIAIAADGSSLYWAERHDSTQTNGHIYTANADDPGEPTLLLDGEASPFGIALVPTATTGEGFATWIASFDLTAEEQSPDADPDGDGLPNLLEYALGGNPASADRDAAPLLGIETVEGSDFLSIAYTKNPAAIGIEYIVEVSSDLVDWEGGDSVISVSEDATAAILRDTLPLDGANRRFIRLRVVEE